MTDGLYVLPHACPGEGCQLGAWVATKPGDLHAQADQASPVIAHVASGENVEALDSVLRLRPVRGVVFRADQGLAVGDVVYLLDGQGEGAFTLWRRGEKLDWMWPSEAAASVDETTGIHWDKPEAAWGTSEPSDPREGWWVQIRRANGQTGWSRTKDYECRPVASDPGHCQLM